MIPTLSSKNVYNLDAKPERYNLNSQIDQPSYTRNRVANGLELQCNPKLNRNSKTVYPEPQTPNSDTWILNFKPLARIILNPQPKV